MEHKSGDDAADGAGNRHEELDFRVLRLFSHLGDTAEDEKSDSFHGKVIVPGNQRMAKLVKHNRPEKPQCARNSHPPIRAAGKPRVGGWENGGCQRPGYECSNHDPGCIQPNFKAEKFENCDAPSEHDFTL